jgi:hypothetical protein
MLSEIVHDAALVPTENSVWSPKPFVTMLHALPSYAPIGELRFGCS